MGIVLVEEEAPRFLEGGDVEEGDLEDLEDLQVGAVFVGFTRPLRGAGLGTRAR